MSNATNHPKAASNKHYERPEGHVDPASTRTPPPTGWTAGSQSQPLRPPRHIGASHMASTTWHTVEFSRNRRASPQDLPILSKRLVRFPFAPRRLGPVYCTRSPGSSEPPLRAALPPGSWAPDRTRGARSTCDLIGVGRLRDRPPPGSLRIRLRVRSSLPGDIENITQPVAPRANPRRGDAAHLARSAR